jgi:RND family efflux transporter MFP subunit
MFMRSPTIGYRGALLLVALPCFFFSGCKGKQEEVPPPATASVAPVTRGDLASTLTVAGEFQPFQEVELHAKVSGYIRRIYVDIGDKVKAGQVIATLEVPELNAQVAGSEAEVRHSQSEISRAQSGVVLAQANYAALHAAYTRLEEAAKQRPGLVAEQELDDSRAKDQDAEARINVAKAALEATQEQLGISKADRQRFTAMQDYSVVTAPFTGVITMRYADVGSLIQAGTTSNTQSMPVVKLAQSDLLRLRMPIPEEDVPFIKTGGDVQIKLQATGKTISGKIIRFTRELATSTRTMLAEVDVPNPDLTLSTGMTAEAIIVLQAQENALTAPAGAVLKGNGQPYVLMVDSDNRVKRVPVTLGIQGSDRVQIIGGLTEHQSVIVSGQSNYQAGQIVRPKLSTISMPGQEGDQ